MLAVDVLVLTFSLWSLLLLPLVSWIAVVAIPSAYFGYRSLSRWRLKRHGSGECAPEPRTLLLLRVFGFDQRAQRLLEELEHRWRFLGPIRVTGSPDLAYSTIRPYEVFEFLTGRLSRRFVSSEQELRARIDGPVTADMDGSFRIQDFYCHADTWKMTVSVLGREADAVVMDLRTFSEENEGCIFEIENLIATVAVQQIVFLVDDSTDIPLLEDTLHRSWRAMPENSPNCSGAGRSITVLRSSSRIRDTADSLMGLLCSDAPIGA
jgi:hypothetical protein